MGYTTLASNMFLTTTSGYPTTVQSPAVALQGASFITVQAQLISTDGANVDITAEVSDSPHPSFG